MPTGTHEQTINTALGEVLHFLGRTWTLRSEHVGRIFEEGGRPDILLEKRDGWPIVIEAEVGNHRQAEIEARSRLGNRLVSTGNTIHASVAVVYPHYLREHHGQALRSELQRAELEYVLFAIDEDLRGEGLEGLDNVKEARLERSGKLSVVKGSEPKVVEVKVEQGVQIVRLEIE